MKEIVFNLYSKELNKDKRIRVFLPSNYPKEKKYKVLYMNDGQNILGKSKYSNASWEVLKTLKKYKINNIIVVGIDSDKDRTKEYVPFPFKNKEGLSLKESKAKEYASFIVNYLKPYIDYHYKTIPSYNSTFIVGSSFGALISTYISCIYKDVFSKIGVFSLASFVVSSPFLKLLNENKIDQNASYFISVGDKEINEKLIKKYGNFYIDSFNDYINILKTQKAKKIYSKIYKDNWHSEVCWKTQFNDFIENILLV